MIEIVLLTFLCVYIIFSWWFVATLLDSLDASINIILSLILTIVAAPLITPIVLGIKVGLFVKNK